jgi:hypothetical protein
MRLTAGEVAKLTGRSVNTVHSARRRGHLVGTPVGRRHWVYSPEALEAWMLSHGTG